jgi:hypothetical protein
MAIWYGVASLVVSAPPCCNVQYSRSRVKKIRRVTLEDFSPTSSDEDNRDNIPKTVHDQKNATAIFIIATKQCCGGENISFGSGSISGFTERQIRIAAPALDNFIRYRYLENYHFLTKRIKIVTIFKNFDNHDFFDTGGNSISALQDAFNNRHT